MSKRILSLIVLAGLLLTLLPACRQSSEPDPSEEPILSASDMAAAISAAAVDRPPDGAERMDSSDPDRLDTYVEAAYGLSDDEWEDCAVILAAGARAYEIAVLRFAGEDEAGRGEECLRSYLKTREGDFFGYLPDQAALVSNAVVCRGGTYVGLFICQEPDKAEADFLSILETGELPEPAPSPEPAPEPAVDMRSLMVDLMGLCMDEIDALGGFAYLDNFIEDSGSTDSGSEYFLTKLDTSYGIDAEGVERGFSVVAPTASHAFELTALCMADEDAARLGAEGFRAYLDSQAERFAQMDLPDESSLAANGRIVQDGRYAALFICRDPEAVAAEFEAQLLLPHSAPDSAPAAGSPLDMEVLAGRLMEVCREEAGEMGGLSFDISKQPDSLWLYFYNLEADQVENSLIVRPKAVVLGDTSAEEAPFELTVICMASEDAAAHSAAGLQLYRWSKKFLLEQNGLAGQAELAADGLIVQNGRYLALFICQDPEAVRAEWEAALAETPSGDPSEPQRPTFQEVDWDEPEGEPDPNHPGRILYVQPGEKDMSLYDTSAILEAWEAGDPSALAESDLAIYENAASVLDQLQLDGMSDFSKEAAVYAWLIENVAYDDTPGTSYTPYGGLVERKAVCLGYATSLELLLKMAGIECTTVVGASFGSTEDHAWNMVRLNGEWYCADPTWELNMSGQAWYFFNVTSDYMARTNHQWDYDAIPEATATDHGMG